MKITTLFSGSSGNVHFIDSGSTKILIDAGVSARRIENALRGIGTSLSEISAIFITHEHTDHTKGLEVISSRHKIPVYMTERSAREMIKSEQSPILPVLHLFPPIFEVNVGDMHIRSFETPHDSVCSVGYTVTFPSGERTVKIGIATDIGHIEDNILSSLEGSDGCIIEANHDVSMLMTGPYPYHLKRRILSDRGHLSNEDCADMLARLAASGTRAFILAHLSRENNYPPTAELCARAAVCAHADISIAVASPDTPTEMVLGSVC